MYSLGHCLMFGAGKMPNGGYQVEITAYRILLGFNKRFRIAPVARECVFLTFLSKDLGNEMAEGNPAKKYVTKRKSTILGSGSLLKPSKHLANVVANSYVS